MSDKKVRSLQRVVDVAAQAFSTRNFTSVSISELSEAARCSTATIYSAFGSKENLFLVAMYHLFNTTRPRSSASDGPSLHVLLGFCEARIRALTDPGWQGALRAVCSQTELAHPLVEDLVEVRRGEMSLLDVEILACREAGVLRPLDPGLIAYTMMAVTGYEPITSGLLYGGQRTVDRWALLERAFAPLVTDEGRRQLDDYLCTMAHAAEDRGRDAAESSPPQPRLGG